jgi:hypothetical protein
MDKWDYIDLISKRDHRYGYLLLEMMERYNKNNLQEITYNESKEFYEEIVSKNIYG